MSEFDAVIRRRRMCRDFQTRPVPGEVLQRVVDAGARAPSAGKTQGWHLVVVRDADTDRFWRHAFPSERRPGFRFPGLLQAPVIALAFADPGAYVARYREPDKTATGLGAGVEAWPTPYWTIDGGMAVMSMLLAAEDAGLGALFFAVFHGVAAVRAELGVPDDLQLLGALALGWPNDDSSARGASADRPRRTPAAIVHDGRW